MLHELIFNEINDHSTLFISLKGDPISVPKTPLAHPQVEVTWPSIQTYVIIRFLTFSH